MIKANELRHGNLVNFMNKPKKIGGSLDIDYASKTRDIQPIPLTPEILEKAGFEWYRPLNHWRLVEGEQWYSVKNVLFNEPKAELLCFSWCNLSWDEASSMPPKVVNYVHQLQNLYFGLTGKELEITF